MGNEKTEKLEVGKTYRHKDAGTLIEVRGISPIPYYDRVSAAYDCFLVVEYKMMQLPIGTENDWEEVVIDCDGLVYELTQPKED